MELSLASRHQFLNFKKENAAYDDKLECKTEELYVDTKKKTQNKSMAMGVLCCLHVRFMPSPSIYIRLKIQIGI